ncbi:MAG: ergothioneine biosynthesis protein EgtB [Acidobacteria bacterium]|nr:ergothioneine biosynthesis protein EgtB [Acidobacteriota bacterium]MYK78669.1 ergothioneine biosynthesis protein EgtB [Acidobacteriota bacterium]
MTEVQPSADLRDTFRRVRRQTAELAAPLAIEDYVVQSMPDARPAKWHVGHTSWYFETFVLGREGVGQAPIQPKYRAVFGVSDAGVEISHDRGLLSRPTVAEVYEYRRRVDEAMEELLEGEVREEVRELVVLGLHHEQQHQERLLVDLKHLFSRNPLHPAYREASGGPRGGPAPPLRFVSFGGGTLPVGHFGTGFAYDNERPRHERRVAPFQLGSRLITNGEYLEFMEEGGYRERSLWLADGWEARAAGGWEAPLHWVRQGGGFAEFSLAGLAPLAADAPVVHVSAFEADAFAGWREARLPTEFEWESAAADQPVAGTFLEDGHLQPQPAPAAAHRGAAGPVQLFGDVWEWTASPYLPYPGFRPSGRFGQSSGRSMSGRMVLRGGSCFTPASHIRASYRHVLRPDARWQATGIRIARDG